MNNKSQTTHRVYQLIVSARWRHLEINNSVLVSKCHGRQHVIESQMSGNEAMMFQPVSRAHVCLVIAFTQCCAISCHTSFSSFQLPVCSKTKLNSA